MTFIPRQDQVDRLSGLSITKSNVLNGLSPIVTKTGTGQTPSHITDPDHSVNYTTSTASESFDVSFGRVSTISYVAISGHNTASDAQGTIELYDDTELIDSVILQRSNNIMFTFVTRTFSNLMVRFIKTPLAAQSIVSFIAAGQHMTIESGEQAGYSRLWLNRHTKQRTTTNNNTAPTSVLTIGTSLSGNLSLPNELATKIEGEWQEFVDFSFAEPFFIKEVADKPESTYICFNPKHGIKAHPLTRVLDSVTLSFEAYNGL